MLDSVQYLAVANYNSDSKIYRWGGGSFAEAQSIPTSGAHDWEDFVLDSVQYLAVANYWDGSSHNIDSKIYRWDGGSFAEAQPKIIYQTVPS